MVIITGAASGIGNYLYNHFEKLDLVIGTYHLSDNNNKKLQQLNIKNNNEVEQWVSQLKFEQMNKIVLINCAGVNYNSFAHKADLSEWHNVIETNLIGTFNVIRFILPHMRKQGFGRVINFGSVVTQRFVPGTSAYTASKMALRGLTKTLAIENASKGITINDINLGYSNIGMGITQITETQKNELKAQIPSGRFCEPDEIVSTVEFLIANDYVNGSAIDLNGALC